MKIIFHENFINKHSYEPDPAADEGRIACIEKELLSLFDFIQARPTTDKNIMLYHSESHIEYVRSLGLTYQLALLAAGGCIMAGEISLTGVPTFALVRPPGHHASADSCWGFCFFNNIVITIEKLVADGKIDTAAIIDFDLHFGDGTNNAFRNNPNIDYYHGSGSTADTFTSNLRNKLDSLSDKDILGVSAGFDRGQLDWGGLLSEANYTEIGANLKEFAVKNCHGKRFAVLEGGYNHAVLGKNVLAFLNGFK
ncbi:MAG: histone deacetylase family protein [Candidatus Hodarchaeales archaeon]|jgi:acetoin utilization deacetylase AcuC-like enzyme